MNPVELCSVVVVLEVFTIRATFHFFEALRGRTKNILLFRHKILVLGLHSNTFLCCDKPINRKYVLLLRPRIRA